MNDHEVSLVTSKLVNKREHCEDQKKSITTAEWITDRTTNAKSPLVKLHNEILDFCNYIIPQGNDIKNREIAIKNVTTLAKTHWPNCEVRLFGSYATGLTLITSDVDIVKFLLL